MEYIKEIKVEIHMDSNKQTRTDGFIKGENETPEEFINRVTKKMKELFETVY